MLRRYICTSARCHEQVEALPVRLAETGEPDAVARIIRHHYPACGGSGFARDRASVTYEELTSRLSEQMGSVCMSSPWLPVCSSPQFLTGLLGINVGGIPLAEDPSALSKWWCFWSSDCGSGLLCFDAEWF